MNKHKLGIGILLLVMVSLMVVSVNNIIVDFDKEIIKINNWSYVDREFVDPLNSEFSGSVQSTRMPGTLIKLTGEGFGYGSFFTSVEIPDEWVGQSISIRKEYILCADELYINGNLVDKIGKISKEKSDYIARYDTRIITIVPETNILNIVVHASNFDDRIGAYKPMEIGLSDTIFLKLQMSTAKELFLIGAIVIMGIYHLGLYVRRKNDMSSLYFGFFCLMIATRNILMGERILIKILKLPDWEVVSKVAYISVFLSLICIFRFCYYVFKDYISEKYNKILSVFVYVCVIITLFTPNLIYDNLLGLFYIVVSIVFIYLLRGIILATINKEKGAMFFVFTISFLSITVFMDMLNQNLIINTGSIVPAGLFVFIFSQAYLLTIKSTEAFKNVEKYSKKISKMNEELEEIVELRTSDLSKALDTLEKRNTSIKNLVDNSNQGFLCFGENLNIDESYGIKCRDILGEDVLGKSYLDIIYKDDESERNFAKDVFNNIFQLKNEDRINVFISLLDTEIKSKDKYIDVKYKMIGKVGSDFKIMVTLTDITEKRFLEEKMESEKSNLIMLVKAFIYKKDLVHLINDFKYFCKSEYLTILNGEIDFKEKVNHLFRVIHTFKGNFSQFYMVEAVKYLSAFEDILQGYRCCEEIDINSELKYLRTFDLFAFLESDLKYIENKVGTKYFNNKNELIVDIDEYRKLEEEIMEGSCGDYSEKLLYMIRKLKYQNIDSLFESYRDYIYDLSKSFGKEVIFEYTQEEKIFVNPEKYIEFTRSLVNIFRNILDHGIELVEERIEMGKPPEGLVKVDVSKNERNIIIEISDDGRGIDFDALRDKYGENYSDSDILKMIFDDNVSSREIIGSISGRGVGLSAVKKSIDGLHGSIEVQSQKGKGTKFEILLPYCDDYVEKINSEEFMDSLVESFGNISRTELMVEKVSICDYDEGEIINGISSAILMKGSINGLVVISAEEKLAVDLVKRMGIDEKYIDLETLVDSIGEFSNMAIGNVLRDFEEEGIMINLGNPIKFYGENSKLFVSSYEIVGKEIKLDDSKVKILFVENVFN